MPRSLMRAVSNPRVTRESSDEDLMQAFKRGDKTAFGFLLDRHQKPLFNFVLKYLRNPEAAEEAFQEIFLRIIRSSAEYKVSAKFTTWLYTVARNYCIDQLRKGRFRQHVSLEQPLGEGDDPATLHDRLADDGHGADHAASAQQLETKLFAVLDEMPEDQKEVFLLREYQGLKFEQIAVLTRSSINTVKSRMRYALKFLQKKFSGIGLSDEGVKS